jgi:threonylcarbamoyladenosine tRNA methylthiotransferase MtaB
MDKAALKIKDSNLNHQDQIFFKENKKEEFFDPALEEKILVNDIMSVNETASHMISGLENKTRAFVQVQNGCNHRCTFCIIPYGRGNSRSVALGEIVAQIKKLVENGYKEVVLTGVDITDYGGDLLGGITFSQMIKRLLNLVPELPRLRISSIDVAEVDDELLEIVANEKRFMPYFHISLQSGDDMILKRMKRRHTRDEVIEFCRKVKKLRPDAAFGSDIIVGFPTETEEMFENTCRLIEEADIVMNHIFPYSIRKGTPAAKMPQVPSSVRKERASRLRERAKIQLHKFLDGMIGGKQKVIIEDGNIGRCENFITVKVDGDLRLNNGDIVEVLIKSRIQDQLICSIV